MALVSVTEYSRITGKDSGTIRKLLIAGRIKGSKIGNQWVIDEKEPFPSDRRIVSGNYKNWRKYSRVKQNPSLSAAVKALVRYARKQLGDSLDGIVLYGSYARGEQTDESDVDIALKLREGYSRSAYKKILDYVATKELECGKVLSVIDIDKAKYDEWKAVIPFYKNIEKEGIVLWQAKSNHILSLEDIKDLLMPIIKKYEIKSLSVFGSYARNEARPDSDVDIIIDGGNYHGLFEYITMIDEMKAALGRDVDVVTKSSLENCKKESDKQFKQNIEKEMILLV